ncbi:hypothetical protein Y1Q_0013512 [Alligator mississippiensis]|uniref:Uncharacterized protein n=1 Tax=Alligator mississippiensis TaxID=8496 RepID=A0A151P397_ALLMI|nr:hypothetical protein Y1Q_0013512 [Alligator mississippiensis]
MKSYYSFAEDLPKGGETTAELRGNHPPSSGFVLPALGIQKQALPIPMKSAPPPSFGTTPVYYFSFLQLKHLVAILLDPQLLFAQSFLLSSLAVAWTLVLIPLKKRSVPGGFHIQTTPSRHKAWSYEEHFGSSDPSTSTPWVIKLCLHLDMMISANWCTLIGRKEYHQYTQSPPTNNHEVNSSGKGDGNCVPNTIMAEGSSCSLNSRTVI